MSAVGWVVIGAVVAGLVTFVVEDGPVSRARLEAFALRHGIAVTTGNAPLLVHYLALTRRWRAAGAAIGLTAVALDGLQHQRVGVNLLAGLAGWFAGALIAELRVSGPVAARRVAALAPRTVEQYAPMTVRVALVVAMGLAALAAAVAAAGGAWRYGAVLLGATLGLPVLVSVVSRRVAVRRQPVDPPDVVAADDAVRRSSVQALHAAAGTLLLFGAAGPFLNVVGHGRPPLALPLALICLVGIPLLGRWLGRVDAPANGRMVGEPAR